MKTKPLDNAKLGLFVLAGLLFLIVSLYLIGRNRNFFGSTFTISASFHNVNGLTTGNNVRFAGIDVGTVREITIQNDTAVLVTMVIDKKARKFIRKNALASVGTDGLMGNKLININSQPEPAEVVSEGDVLLSNKPVETDEMLRTLNTTNNNFEAISHDLKKITQKINNSNSLWQLLSDTLIAKDLKEAAVNVRIAGANAARASKGLADLTQSVKDGSGLAGTLVTDTLLTFRLRKSLNDIQAASERTASAAGSVLDMMEKVKRGEGTAGAILTDTLLLHKLNVSLDQVEEGTKRFSENMEAMRSNFLFRGYFRKLEKEEKKKEQEKNN